MPGRINLTPATRQGFTGHEHLDSLALIHMNGRVYDHRLGRFLSVDPFIQFPANSQSLNPYSYIMNNPMAGMDPSGYRARGLRTPFMGNGPCMGDIDCEMDQTFSGPVSDFRKSFSTGGAPKSAWNGRESASIIPKVKSAVGGTVEIGSLTSIEAAFTSDPNVSPSTAPKMGSTVNIAETGSLAFRNEAEQSDVYLTDLEGRAFSGQLSSAQQADLEAAKLMVGTLRQFVDADSPGGKVLQDTNFRYVPLLRPNKLAGHIRLGREGVKGHLITIYEGYSSYVRGPLPPEAGGYNFSFTEAGDTVGLFILGHELGHGVLNAPVDFDGELRANDYALQLVRTYVGYDPAALKCEQFCD